MYEVITEQKGKKTLIKKIICNETGEIITPKFDNYTCYEDFINANIKWVEPMTAKEYLNEEELEEMLNSEEFIAEEKLDGTRCTMHLLEGGNRLFSRRISKKTDWFSENTDSVPHLRDLDAPEEFLDSVLDGEMRIDGKEFKDVSSTLNCTWDEAILRQSELGYITFHAFDIVYYRGVYVAKMPLARRKELLEDVVRGLDNDYVKEERYTNDKIVVKCDKDLLERYKLGELANPYPNLHEALDTLDLKGTEELCPVYVDKRTWYEFILATGGEGLMLKSLKGTYKHTRGREYTKWKKFSTWDVVILDFIEPTRDYTGKELNNPNAEWHYWYDAECESVIVHDTITMIEAEKRGLLPCTKHYAHDWIGTIKYGVIITEAELEKWKKDNPKDKPEVFETAVPTGTMQYYLVVGECSGFDEETREYMTSHAEQLIGDVIEVGANEIMKTGKLRHPRFLRFRDDKEADRCIWKDHMRVR